VEPFTANFQNPISGIQHMNLGKTSSEGIRAHPVSQVSPGSEVSPGEPKETESDLENVSNVHGIAEKKIYPESNHVITLASESFINYSAPSQKIVDPLSRATSNTSLSPKASPESELLSSEPDETDPDLENVLIQDEIKEKKTHPYCSPVINSASESLVNYSASSHSIMEPLSPFNSNIPQSLQSKQEDSTTTYPIGCTITAPTKVFLGYDISDPLAPGLPTAPLPS